MGNIALKIIPSTEKNYISYSKNYRIFGTVEKIEYASKIVNFKDSVSIGSNDIQLLNRFFRYSKNKDIWSMWYDIDNGSSPNMSEIAAIILNPDEDFYVELKYEYDNGTNNTLPDSIVINFATIYIELDGPKVTLGDITPNVACSDESCLSVVINRDPSFDPYAVGDMTKLAQNMSFAVNQIFGLDSVYFHTSPVEGAGDYIFKEWNLYDVDAMKCVKIALPGNKFPDNMPYFHEDGLDYEEPFEVHIDKIYFESIFGKEAEPRNKDFVYFPLVNRIYKISGAYLKRGFMMQHIFWRLMLTKFKPNINYILKAEETQYLDNLLLNSENTLSEIANKETEDALMPKQYKTISERFDETRRALNENLIMKQLSLYYNYNMFIEYYYDQNEMLDDTYPVVYKESPKLNDEVQNITYTSLFKMNSDTTMIELLYGKEIPGSPSSPSDDTSGIHLYGMYDAALELINIFIVINDIIEIVTIEDVEIDKWYGIILQASVEFNQYSLFVYDTTVDSIDEGNITDFNLKKRHIVQVAYSSPNPLEFNVDAYYTIKKSNIDLANIRIFKTNIKEEQHSYILSSLFVKNESDLILIDNCRPRLNAPFIAKSR